MKCKCGKEYRQLEYNGKIPKYCSSCGFKLNQNEDYINIGRGRDDSNYLFISGRLDDKTLDFRFDTNDGQYCEFPEHEYKFPVNDVKAITIHNLLIMIMEGQLSIAEDVMK